jgi:hypothetical protein
MSWPITWPESVDLTGVPPTIKSLAESYARTSMAALTLHRVGGSPVTILPDTDWRQRGHVYRLDGVFGSFSINPSAEDLKDGFYEEVEALLLPGPVGAITEIRVDGEVLDPLAYRLEDGSRVIRLDGKSWPIFQSDDFTVTYLNSHAPGELGSYAAGVLAAEFLKVLNNDARNCRLPKSVTNVTRQGLTFEVAKGLFPDGLTGLPEVDAYLMLFNPFGLKVAPRVYSPDLPKHRQVWP